MCSTSAVEARPVRTLTRSWRSASMLLDMRACASLWMSLIMAGSGTNASPKYSERPLQADPASVAAVRGPVVAIVFARVAALDLQRRMIDAEALVQLAHEPVDEDVVVLVARAHEVRGHRDLAGAQRPDVQVMHRGDSV